jgi:hypothetical protein
MSRKRLINAARGGKVQRQEDPRPRAGSGETTVCCCAIRRARLAATCCDVLRLADVKAAPNRSRLPAPAVHNCSGDCGSSSPNSLNSFISRPDRRRQWRADRLARLHRAGSAAPLRHAPIAASAFAIHGRVFAACAPLRKGSALTANPARRRCCVSIGSLDLLGRHVPDPAAAPLVSRFSARAPPRSSPPLSDPDHGEGIMCPLPRPRCTLIDPKFPACRHETCAS